MKKTLISLVSALLISGGASPVLAQSSPLPGLTPDSPFYFLDRLGEAFQEFFTFNPEAKARLEINFAAERIAEIKVLLDTKGVQAKGIDVAQSDLLKNLDKAAVIVKSEKDKGKDVQGLAKELSDEFDSQKQVLKDAFKDSKDSLKSQADQLREKISEARVAGDTAQVDALTRQLNDLKAQRDLLDTKENDDSKSINEKESGIEEEMDSQDEVQKTIDEAETAKQELIDEAAKDGVEIPAGTFDKFDQLISQAKDLLTKSNYEGAKQLAKQAEKTLEKIDEATGNLRKATEKEQELKDEKELEGDNSEVENSTSTNNSDLEKAKEEKDKAEKDVKHSGDSEIESSE